MRYSRSVLLVIIEALLIGLVPAAYSSPPDPTWITGYWDDHDFDHAVISIVNACATAAPSAPDTTPQLDLLTGIGLAEPAFSPFIAWTGRLPGPPVVPLARS